MSRLLRRVITTGIRAATTTAITAITTISQVTHLAIITTTGIHIRPIRILRTRIITTITHTRTSITTVVRQTDTTRTDTTPQVAPGTGIITITEPKTYANLNIPFFSVRSRKDDPATHSARRTPRVMITYSRL